MASKVVGQQLQDLVCPICLDVFKNATLLNCGHTFCKGCLEAYDEQHHLDHIVCPVCRENTNLGLNRVAGLKPNFIIQDKLHVFAQSQSFCPFHKNAHNDIFCEDCKEFICLTCFSDSHKDHKIKKKEALERDLREKRDSLIRDSEMRKAQIVESVNSAEQHRIDTHSHFCKVEKEIKYEFARRVTILQQKEESLLNELNSIMKETENQFEGFIANQRQAIDDINNSITILSGYIGNNVDSDAIKTQYLQCSELEKSLKRSIDEASIVRLQQTSESTLFRPSDEKLLALGHIQVGVKETSNLQQVKTATGTNRKSERLETRRKVAVIPPPVRSKVLNIVRQVEALQCILGMAAPSQDAVAVGYGWWGPRSTFDRFSVSGEKSRHLIKSKGFVYDIAFFTDGRYVVSPSDDTDRCNKGSYHICVDQDDNIYATYATPEIYISHGSNPNQQRVIPTCNIIPIGICATKTGVLITRSRDNRLDTLTVFDREGHVGSSITASDWSECLHATVDSQDRVLVARLSYKYDVVRLTRYTLQGTALIQQVTFNELKLPLSYLVSPPSCIKSLAPKLVACSNGSDLYFIELPE